MAGCMRPCRCFAATVCTTCRSRHTDGNINQAVCSITVVGGNAHGGVVVANLKRTAASDIRPQQALMLVVVHGRGPNTAARG